MVLHAQGDLLLLRVEGDDIHVDLVAHGDHLSGVLDAAPGQFGHVDHAVHTADVHKGTIGSQRLHRALILLALFDVCPDLGGLGSALLCLNSADGAHHTAAGTVDLGDTQLHAVLDHLGQVGPSGHSGLRGGHEDTDALDIDHDTALVDLGHGTLQDGLVLYGSLNGVPVFHAVQALLGQGGNPFHIVDPHDIGLDLVAHLHDVLGLYGGIVAQLRHGDVTGVLGAQVHVDLGGGDAGDDTSDLVSRI